MEGHPKAILFEEKGYRDVWWCHVINEPSILEWRDEGDGRNPYCAHCTVRGTWLVNSDGTKPVFQVRFYGDHTFICHLKKPGVEHD